MALWELYDRFKVLDSCFTDLTAFQPHHFQLARHLTLNCEVGEYSQCKVLTFPIQALLDHLVILALRLLLDHVTKVQRLQLVELIHGVEQKDNRLLPENIHGYL